MNGQLTSAQRLDRCLRGQPVDRVPIWMLYNPLPQANPWYPDHGREPSYAQVLERVMADTDLFQRHWFGPGVFYTDPTGVRKASHAWREMGYRLSETTIETPAGTLTAYTRRTAQGIEHKALIAELEDFDRILSLPYQPYRPDLGEFRRLQAELGERGLMMINLCDPMALLYFHCDAEPLLLWSALERERVVHFLDAMYERLLKHLKYLLEEGAGPCFFIVGSEFACPPMLSPAAFRDLVVRYDRPLIELIHSYDGLAIIHHHGAARAILDDLLAMGADGIHPLEAPPVGDTPLAEAKRRIGERVALIGNLQYDTLIRGSLTQVEAEARAIIEAWKPGGPLILAPTAGPYQDRLSPEAAANIVRFIALAHEEGSYA